MQFIKLSNNKWFYPAPASGSVSALSSLKRNLKATQFILHKTNPNVAELCWHKVLQWLWSIVVRSLVILKLPDGSEVPESFSLSYFASQVKATCDKMPLKTMHTLPLDILTGLVPPFFSGWWAQLFLWLARSSGKITVLALHHHYDFHVLKH